MQDLTQRINDLEQLVKKMDKQLSLVTQQVASSLEADVEMTEILSTIIKQLKDK